MLFPQYDYLFMFDHSCGHDKQREDGMNVQRMSKLYVGKQPKMQDTVIIYKKGFLGPFTRTLRVGDTQSLFFKAGDSGTFWLSMEEQERKWNDVLKEGQSK
jgi:hypothetical protein